MSLIFEEEEHLNLMYHGGCRLYAVYNSPTSHQPTSRRDGRDSHSGVITTTIVFGAVHPSTIVIILHTRHAASQASGAPDSPRKGLPATTGSCHISSGGGAAHI
jgi:hypothetical protein